MFLASTGNADAKNTSNARFGQVLSEIWPPEGFWVSKLMWAGADGSSSRANMPARQGLVGQVLSEIWPSKAF